MLISSTNRAKKVGVEVSWSRGGRVGVGEWWDEEDEWLEELPGEEAGAAVVEE